MVMLVTLADIARGAGLHVVEVSGWQSRGHGEMDADIRTITCHHTAGPTAKRDPDPYPSLSTVVHGRPGLAGPLAQLGLGRDGTVYVIAAGLCWHAGFSRNVDFTNRYAIGIEAENAGTKTLLGKLKDPWPAVQVEAYARLCAALVKAGQDGTLVPGRRLSLDVEDVRGHKETCDPPGRKSDPLLDMASLRTAVRRDLLEQRADRSVVRERPKPRPTLHRVLVAKRDPLGRWKFRGGDVKAVQRALGLKGADVDGVYGAGTAQLVREVQARRHLRPDGKVGPATAHALGLGWTA